MKRVVGAVPARWGSTRLPGKPLLPLLGKPMIQHVVERARAAPSLSRVVVLTDDERIRSAVEGFGGECEMTPADCRSGTDRIAWAARSWDDVSAVVNVQGDEPLIDPSAIDAAIAPLADRPQDVLSTLRRRLTNPADLANPAVVKVVVDRHGYGLYFSRSPLPHARAGSPEPVFWRHLGLYVYRRETLERLAGLAPTPLEQAEGLEQLRALEHGIRILTVETTCDALGVDTPEDLEHVRRLVEATGAHP
jgi:3-deoxy-manno-octulosonate cytidylyltransferase (CMP-KDO synthetase)